MCTWINVYTVCLNKTALNTPENKSPTNLSPLSHYFSWLLPRPSLISRSPNSPRSPSPSSKALKLREATPAPLQLLPYSCSFFTGIITNKCKAVAPQIHRPTTPKQLPSLSRATAHLSGHLGCQARTIPSVSPLTPDPSRPCSPLLAVEKPLN